MIDHQWAGHPFLKYFEVCRNCQLIRSVPTRGEEEEHRVYIETPDSFQHILLYDEKEMSCATRIMKKVLK
jgi:hypothetical protein